MLSLSMKNNEVPEPLIFTYNDHKYMLKLEVEGKKPKITRVEASPGMLYKGYTVWVLNPEYYEKYKEKDKTYDLGVVKLRHVEGGGRI